MKWDSNKGRNLEKFSYLKDKDIYIYGAGNRGMYLYQTGVYYRDFITGFIDREEKKSIPLCKPIISPANIQNAKETNCIIVISLADQGEVANISVSLEEKEYIHGKDYFCFEEWNEWYKYLYLYVKKNIVVAPFLSLQFTTICNLSCRGCVACNPQVKQPRHLGVEYFRDNLNLIFKHIDFADRLDVCGGEPFIGNGMIDILKLIEPLRHRINKLSTVTNGTIIPSDELCYALYKANIVVKVDDYSEVLKDKTHINEIIEKLEKFHVVYEVNKVEHWIYLGWEQNLSVSELEAEDLFIRCKNMRKSIHNHKLFACDYAGYANEAEVILGVDSDYIDLTRDDIPRSAFMEFLLGYNEKGYCEACRYCNGGVCINNTFIPVAEQVY